MDCEQQGTECRVKLSGRINIDSSPDLRLLLLRMLTASHCRVLIVDFCEVAYIDTSGIAVLVQILKSAKQLGKNLQLSGLRERPRYLLASSGLLRLFDESDHK